MWGGGRQAAANVRLWGGAWVFGAVGRGVGVWGSEAGCGYVGLWGWLTHPLPYQPVPPDTAPSTSLMRTPPIPLCAHLPCIPPTHALTLQPVPISHLSHHLSLIPKSPLPTPTPYTSRHQHSSPPHIPLPTHPLSTPPYPPSHTPHTMPPTL